MPAALLGLLKLCLLALVYLFFLRVLWAVWSEVRAPASAAMPIAPGAPVNLRAKDPTVRPVAASRLVFASPAERAGEAVDLFDEVTIGRATGCKLSLPADTFLSQLHARVFEQDGVTQVEDLGSTNGTWINGERITDPVTVQHGDRVQVGSTVLEVA
jgi:hypothetical protein